MVLFSLRNFARTSGRTAPALLLCLALAGCPATQPTHTVDQAKPNVTAPPVQAVPAPAQAAPAAPATPEQRRTQQLSAQVIAQAERALSSGQGHYRKGQLVQAKSDFDSAVDVMLASGLDIKSDPQLNDEFNHILDAVNALETEALKRGNGFAPAVEPTPADVANDVTFEVDPNFVAKAKAELATTKSDLPLVINDYVAAYINFYANTQRGHNTLLHSFQRAGRYKAMIQRVLNEEGVPQDLIYLAVAESAFQPAVVNRGSGAGGMWQFMPQAQYYGLTRNAYLDERFDPEKSTRAYARYMKMLYNQFGDWFLAMAAYNWGGGYVQRAVQKTGYADFWELYKRNNLPGETKNYVPQILAAIIISRNLSHYGFEDVQSDPAIVSDTVPIDYAVDVRLVADVIDMQPQDVMALNPGLLRMATPPPGMLPGPFDLHLPPGTATLFRQRIVDIPQDRRAQWRYHRVTPEDTLATVARNYHVSVAQLISVNQLEPSASLDNVEALVVPVAPVVTAVAHVESYKARRGDTLVKIADRFGVSLDDLHRWNHLTGTSVAAGQRIHVTEPARAAVRSAQHAPEHAGHSTVAQAGKSSGSGVHGMQSSHAATGKSASQATSAKASPKNKAAAASSKSGDSKKAGVPTKHTTKKNVAK